MRRILLAVALAASGAFVAPTPGRAAPASPARDHGGPTARNYGGPVARTQVMLRGLDWLRRDVAYSQDNRKAVWDRSRGRRYRPDCSGFVAMAWALDPRRAGLGRAPVTWELPAVSTRVRWDQLRRGDILLRLDPANRAREHVRLFAGWADRGRTRAWVLEQSGRADGMRRKAVAVAEARRGYLPYRYRNIA